jgi:hypothetical protein
MLNISCYAQDTVHWGEWLSWGEQKDGTYRNPVIPADYSNEQFHKAQKTFILVLERRAASVLGQMKGEIPATWDGQKAQPQLLINSNDINLQDLGGI